MPSWLSGLLLFLVVCVLFTLAARRIAIVGARVPFSPDNGPEGGATLAPLDAYFDKISELEAGGYDTFFVSLKDPESDRILQVSVDLTDDTNPVWQFDMPLNAAQHQFENRVSFEAKSRGLTPIVSSGSDTMRFLDINFPDRSAHDAFARWVVGHVFELSEDMPYDISWG